jgi:peptidyl-tRNA hydrolase, PTH1 family
MSKYLIAGLGNPGKEYANTRHNIGFLVADKLVKDEGGSFAAGRLADVAHIKYKGRQVVVIKPSTFMNLSGKAINYWLQAENIPVTNLMVVVDELALPLGKIRVGPKGSDGGHNGLKSVQESLGSPEYPRMRFGIGNEFSKGAQVNYVLSGWSEQENALLNDRISIATEALKLFVFAGLQQCMNQFNNK